MISGSTRDTKNLGILEQGGRNLEMGPEVLRNSRILGQGYTS